jgi:hypothetical protein
VLSETTPALTLVPVSNALTVLPDTLPVVACWKMAKRSFSTSLCSIEAVRAAATVTSNHISNSGCYGIALLTGGATFTNNIITSNGLNNCKGIFEAHVGISFDSHTNTVSGNTINGTVTGIEYVPAFRRHLRVKHLLQRAND